MTDGATPSHPQSLTPLDFQIGKHLPVPRPSRGRRLRRPDHLARARNPYPVEANGFQAEGPWAGITKARILGLPPYVYTSSANILADLRARDAADTADVYGAGFEVTTNP